MYFSSSLTFTLTLTMLIYYGDAHTEHTYERQTVNKNMLYD